ncbi:MAG: SGNH/GDSL hydrolase family protein [Alphaproteobacteria bacterium]
MARPSLPRKASFSRGPTPAQHAGLVCLGVMLGLLAAEIGCRLLHAKPWYQGLVEAPEGPTEAVHLNSLGLRDIDYASPKPSGVKRVLFLGDAVTFGAGMPRDDATFPELVERRLVGALREQEHEVEVLNGGRPGSLTGDWLREFTRVAPLFQPDVVIAVFFLRDGASRNSMADFFGAIRNGIVRRNEESALYRHSALWRSFRDGLDQRQVASDYVRALNLAFIGDEKQRHEWLKAEENLQKIASATVEMGARFGLVVFPLLADLDQDPYPFDRIGRLVAQFGHEQAWPTLDLLPTFLGQDARTLWVSPTDQRPNELAHRVAADAIVPFVKTLLDRSMAPAPGAAPGEPTGYPQA